MFGTVGSNSRAPIWAAALVVAAILACGGSQAAPSGFSVVEQVPAEPASLVGEGDAAQPRFQEGSRPGGAYGFSHYFFEEVGGEVIATLVEGPLGDQVRSNLTYTQLKQLHEQGSPPPDDLKMTGEQLAELVQQLDTLREATAKYWNVGLAKSDGYVKVGGEFPNMGAHFVHPGRMADGVFDPAEPEFLLYTQDEAKKWELVGTGFILPTPLVGARHPEGFAGPLDNWHIHYNLCLGGTVGASSTTEEECQEQRGAWLSSYGWMMHSYVWVDNPLGVFGMWNPNIPPVMPAADLRETRVLDQPREGEVPLTIENFTHRDVQLKVGETLHWINVDGVPHTVTSGSQGAVAEGFDSGFIAPGRSFALKFDEPGEYPYTCTLHTRMNGAIRVAQ